MLRLLLNADPPVPTVCSNGENEAAGRARETERPVHGIAGSGL